MNINYKLKEGINPASLIPLLQGNFPYELELSHENGL